MSEQGRTAADAETAIRNWLIYREEQHTEDDLQLVLAELERLSKAWGEARAELARRDTTIAAARELADDWQQEARTSAGTPDERAHDYLDPGNVDDHRGAGFADAQDECADRLRVALSAPVEAGTPAECEPDGIGHGDGWRCPACAGRMRADQLPKALRVAHKAHERARAEAGTPAEPTGDTAALLKLAARIAAERWAGIPQSPIWDRFPELATSLFDLEAAVTRHDGRGLSPAQEFHLAALAGGPSQPTEEPT